MKQIREQHQPDDGSRCTANADSRMQDDSQVYTRNSHSSSSEGSIQTDTNQATPGNSYVLCLTEEQLLALLPCSHDYANNSNEDPFQLVFQGTTRPVRIEEEWNHL